MHRNILAAAVLVIVVGGASSGLSAMKENDPARAVGKPVKCIPIRSIQSTSVIDDSTIDFKLSGGRTYRNILPHSCPGLKSEDKFSYRTSLSQLCSVDIIHVLHDYGGRLSEGAGCGLGVFQPIEKTTANR